MKKSKFSPAKLLGFLFLPCILLLIGAGCVGGALKDYYHYTRLQDTAVPVEAIITRVVEKTDSDDNTYYEAYVTYTYAGKTYENIRHGRCGENSLGGKQTVLIDPQNPTLFRPEDSKVFWMAFGAIIFLFPCFICIMIFVSGAVSMNKAGAYWPELYRSGWLSHAVVQKDITCEQDWVRRGWLIVAGIITVLCAAFCVVYYLQTGYWITLLPFGLSAVPVLCIAIRKFCRRETPKITLKTDTFKEKFSEYDSDGPATHYLIFEKHGKWKIEPELFVSVRNKQFHDLRVGDQVILACNDKNHVLRLFSAEDFRCI